MIPDAKEESDTERDGFLSYAGEWHSLTHGVYQGLTTKPTITPPMPNRYDVLKEPHYYQGGYILGTILQVVIIISLLAFGWIVI